MHFYGPFASWVNVKNFGAKGDGVTDDSIAIQNAIDYATTNYKTLWVPSGTYRILTTLHVVNNDGVTITGEDPLTTKFYWDGAVNGTMFASDGSTHYRISRTSFDCHSELAAMGIQLNYSNQVAGQNYPTWVSIGDMTIKGCTVGIQPEYAGETTVNRVHFDHNHYGVKVDNWNALNFNVTDSLFTDNFVSMSNMDGGSGAFNVSNSVFVRSQLHDMEIGNTQSFSIRHNLSVDSNQFFYAGWIESNAAVTLEGNVVNDTVDVPIIWGNQGTLTLIDNTFNMPNNPQRPLYQNNSPLPTYVVSVGNTYTTTVPYYSPRGAAPLSVTTVDEAPLAVMPVVSWTVPTEVYIPPASTAPVFEVPTGGTSADIQNAINSAVNVSGGATVHLPTSSFFLNTTVDVPNAPGLMIVGDGQYTDLRHGPTLIGPVLRTHGSVDMDGFFISGSSSNASVQLLLDDQPSSMAICDECTTVNVGQSMSVSGLDHARINTRATTLNGKMGVELTGGQNQANGKLTLGGMDAFMSTSDTYTVAKGGHFLISDGWHDGGQTGVQAIVSDNAMVTHAGGVMNLASPTGIQGLGLTGQLSLVGTQIGTAVTADPATTGIIGMVGTLTGTPTQLSVASSSAKVVHAGDIISTPSGYTAVVSTPAASADVERVLSQSRTEFVVPRQTLVTSAMRVHMHRIMFGDGALGLSIASNQSTPRGASYSISDPSGSGSLGTSCSAGTVSLSGSWSLVSGADGFYGLMQGGLFLSNTIDALNGNPSLGTTANMMDAGQRWIIAPTGDGLFQITNRADGSLLTTTPSGCATLSTAGSASNEWAVAVQ